MAKELATSEFEPSANVIELPLAPRREASPEAAAPAIDVRAKSAREIGTEFGVSDRAIQNAIKTVFAAYPWLDLKQLRIGNSNKTRYTPLCQQLLAEFRASGLSAEDWINLVWNAHPEEFARYSQGSTPIATDTPLSQTEVLPKLDEAPTDRRSLPPVDRTARGSLIHTGRSFLDSMGEEEQQLQDLEAQELALLGRMQQSFQRLDQSQQQWDRTADLRRQRLLRETRLEAAALATELEAEFNDTLHETQYRIRRGAVGKSIAENPRSPSA